MSSFVRRRITHQLTTIKDACERKTKESLSLLQEKTKGLAQAVVSSLSNRAKRLWKDRVQTPLESTAQYLTHQVHSGMERVSQRATAWTERVQPVRTLNAVSQRIFWATMAGIFVYGLATSIPQAVASYHLGKAKLQHHQQLHQQQQGQQQQQQQQQQQPPQ